jgi:hypothetical protein
MVNCARCSVSHRHFAVCMGDSCPSLQSPPLLPLMVSIRSVMDLSTTCRSPCWFRCAVPSWIVANAIPARVETSICCIPCLVVLLPVGIRLVLRLVSVVFPPAGWSLASSRLLASCSFVPPSLDESP